MATIISSIGSNARDFASIQAWVDSIPASLVAAGNNYVGLLYNDSEFLEAAGRFTLSGKTTDANNRITLKPAPGQGFREHPNHLNNPLFYNQSYGVALKSTAAGALMNISVPYTIVDGIQISAPSCFTVSGTGVEVRNLIALGNPVGNIYTMAGTISANAQLINSLVIVNNAASAGGVQFSNGTAINCTIVRPSNFANPGSIGLLNNYNINNVKNCAIFGFGGRDQYPYGTFSVAGSSNNASDWTQAPGTTNNLTSLVYANQFVNSTNDFRLKAGSDLIGKGANLAATYGTTDIVGTTRQTAWDIGAHAVILPATTLKFSGPSFGQVGVDSTNFTISTDGSIAADVHVNLSDNAGGGVWTPSAVTLASGTNPTAMAIYKPGTAGNKQLSITSDSTLANPAALSFNAVNSATGLAITPPAEKGRAGVLSSDFKVELNGMPEGNVVVTLTDDLGTGVFSPASITLTQATLSSTFKYKGAAGGQRTITATNDKGYPVATATFFLKDPIVAKPTPSTDSLIVKSIGTGKDFSTIRDFANYVNGLDLESLKASIIGEVYENAVGQANILFNPAIVSGNFSITLQPVPGLGVGILDRGDPLDYGTDGIEWAVGSSLKIGRGIIVQDFRILIDGANSINISGSVGSIGMPWLRRNRIKATTTAHAVSVGEYGASLQANDNIFIMESGTGNGGTSYALSASSYALVSRNTFVRRGNSTAKALNVSNSQNTANKWVIGDNAFVGFGSSPFTGLELVPAASIYNNMTDIGLATARAGITTPVLPMLRNAANDFRPDDAGALIGAASANALDTYDIYGINRGGNPDVGAVQGSIVNALPQVTVTSCTVRGNKLIISGTTRFSPTTGYVKLVPDDTKPAGAVESGPFPLTVGPGVFSLEQDGIHFGNYKIPLVRMTNEAGTNVSQIGGELITILPVSAKIVAGQSAPTVGNAAVVTVGVPKFDNDTVSVEGTVDLQGDATGTVMVYLDSIADPNVTIGPVKANIVGNKWGVQVKNVKGGFKVRAVGNANAKPVTTVIGNPKKIIEYKAKITLPTR